MGRINQLLKSIREGIVQQVPAEYKVCESCRDPDCDVNKAAQCQVRIQAELEGIERKDRI